MRGRILKSINNIYTAECLEDGKTYTLRIKGKVLQSVKGEYNPIAVGDIVIFDTYSPSEGLLTEREERTSDFTRWNVKHENNQTIACNMDQTAIVVSVENPPFRPRFLDRAICSVHGSDILIVVNKIDLEAPEWVFQTLENYEKLGFKVVYVSAGENDLEELLPALKGKTTAFVGQSGVGKSSLINALVDAGQRTGEIIDKYNRGRHTTNYSIFLKSEDFNIIDTPGVREIMVPFEDEETVRASFPEFDHVVCAFPDCMHRGEEGCSVPEMLENGEMDEDRYESYLRILESLEERRPIYMRKKILAK